MPLLARDLMVTEFETIGPEDTVREAIRLMRFARNSTRGRRIFGLVVQSGEQVVGMISMYDILHNVRPPHKRIWDDSLGLGWEGQLEAACERAKKLKVKDVMTRAVISVDEDTSIVQIIHLMTRHHIRRLPVLRGSRLCGIVYISDIFTEVHNKLIPQP